MCHKMLEGKAPRSEDRNWRPSLSAINNGCPAVREGVTEGLFGQANGWIVA